jgi:hypothetical protein
MDSLLTVACSCDSIMGHVEDFFFRDDFQQRGALHLHWLAFIKGAPKYGKASDAEVCAFVSKHLSCQRDHEIEADLIQLQVHIHSNSCYRKETGNLPHCRSRFPQPPMQETRILTPLPDDMPKQKSKAHRRKWKKIFDRLKEIDLGKELLDIELHEFLDNKKWSETEYISILLIKPTLFLRRGLAEMRMNLYNKETLIRTRSNMDMQYCLDPYAAATCVASYLMKGQRGMSKHYEKRNG